MSLTFAACQYVAEPLPAWEDHAAQLESLARQAAEAGAGLLLLPEYAAMGLTSILPQDVRSDLQASIRGLQDLLPRWLDLCRDLARRHDLVFCPGSAPVLDPDGAWRNRAFLFGPTGPLGHQDKQIMTRFEREEWFISAGQDGLRLFETPLGRLGLLICYDIEFPMLARQLVEQGADLILVPSCTDTPAGAHRVRIGAQARALEGQLPVLVSATAGLAPWSPALDENHGRCALYVPPDYGMPEDGVAAQSPDLFTAQTRLLLGSVDLEAVRALRTKGQVALHRDWPGQFTR